MEQNNMFAIGFRAQQLAVLFLFVRFTHETPDYVMFPVLKAIVPNGTPHYSPPTNPIKQQHVVGETPPTYQEACLVWKHSM